MNKQLLSSLGITGNEANLYLAVLKHKQASPSQLAKLTGIKRTTAYHIARLLVEKGLLTEDLTNRPRVFLPASPDDILLLAHDEKKQLEKRETLLQSFAGELSRLTADETYTVPTVRFVQEKQLESFLYRQTLRWHQSMMQKDATWWGFQDHTFIEHFGKVTDWYWKKTKEKFSVKLLSNQSPAEDKIWKKYPGRTIKFWNKTNHFLSTTWVAGDFVVMVNTRQHPFHLVEIHDATLAHDQREVFKNLWGLI